MDSNESAHQGEKPSWAGAMIPVVAGVVAAGLLAAGLLAAGTGYWFLTRNQETTDDSFIEANVVQIALAWTERSRAVPAELYQVERLSAAKSSDDGNIASTQSSRRCLQSKPCATSWSKTSRR